MSKQARTPPTPTTVAAARILIGAAPLRQGRYFTPFLDRVKQTLTVLPCSEAQQPVHFDDEGAVLEIRRRTLTDQCDQQHTESCSNRQPAHRPKEPRASVSEFELQHIH